jgi:prephenate dehydrogenase
LRVAIVGLGLIGTSIALALRRAEPATVVIGIDHPDVIQHPRIVETFTVATTDLAAVAPAELIVLAAPVQSILEVLPKLRTIAPGARITDTGSTKRVIVSVAREASLDFVGGHPMAGSDRRGSDAARADLFDTRSWFLVGTGRSLVDVGRFVQRLGALPVFLTDDGAEHDRIMAAVSHLPQVVVSALMARVGESIGREALSYAGSGLRDTTRLAGSEASVWESILATNTDALRPLVAALADDLRDIADRLDDPAAMRRLFGMANMYRRDLMGQTS